MPVVPGRFDEGPARVRVPRLGDGAAARGLANVVTRPGAVELLPFEDDSFDLVLSRYSAHHWRDVDAGLREAARVLKPGARFVILELATPRFAPLRALYHFYFRKILPAIGRFVSKHREAYTYLPESVLGFPEPEALAQRLRTAGFSRVGYELREAKDGLTKVRVCRRADCGEVVDR